MDFSFVHAADIHLDSPLKGLQKYEGAPVDFIRGASRAAFKNLTDFSLEAKVNFLLIAGDLYDGEWRDYNTGLFFAAQMSRLRDAGIKVFIVKGNHDAASQITRNLRLPDNVKDFPVERSGTEIIEDIKVAVHGRGFASQAVTEDLSRTFPEKINGYFNIGLLHTCANGREGHGNYAPCDINFLISKDYDYWALGHVHKREVISQDPFIVFPGNLQGRNIRERGAKGCTYVAVSEGVIREMRHVDLDVLRWTLSEVELKDIISLEDIYPKISLVIEKELGLSEERLLAMRIIIRGATPLHRDIDADYSNIINNIRLLATDISADRLWLEKIKIESKSLVEREKIISYPPIASMLSFLKKIANDESMLSDLSAELSDFRAALPPEVFDDSFSGFKEHDELKELLPAIEDLIISSIADSMGEED